MRKSILKICLASKKGVFLAVLTQQTGRVWVKKLFISVCFVRKSELSGGFGQTLAPSNPP